MISNQMYSAGVFAVGTWQPLRVDETAFTAAHHAIANAKRRTAAETVASVNRGLS